MSENTTSDRQTFDTFHTEETEATTEQKKQAKTVSEIGLRLHELKQEKAVRDTLNSFVDKVDQNSVLEKARHYWDEMPHAVQWAMLNLPIGLMGVQGPMLKMMVSTGLLTYKGALTEKDMKEMDEWDRIKFEWSVKIGKYFIPELKAVELLMEPILAIKKTTNEIFEDVRFHLKESRRHRENMGKVEDIRKELLGDKYKPQLLN